MADTIKIGNRNQRSTKRVKVEKSLCKKLEKVAN
jgi:hypothetical protein